MSLNAIIVDDERLARRELRSLLSEIPAVTIVAEAATLGEARAALHGPVDVVFLDIQLGGENGFDLVESIPVGTKIVFVTAHEEYAVRAFDVDAVDYLLKPVSPQRLRTAVSKLERTNTTSEPRRLDGDDRVLLPLRDHYTLVPVRAIETIEAAGDYSEVHLADQRHVLVYRPLREWESRLPAKSFLRIHRSAIINLDFVERVEPWMNSTFRIHMKHRREPLVSSRRYTPGIRSRLS